jgi:hypothetical protein
MPGGTPLTMQTPYAVRMGGQTSIRDRGMSPGRMMSPGFTPNIYADMNRFTPDITA